MEDVKTFGGVTTLCVGGVCLVFVFDVFRFKSQEFKIRPIAKRTLKILQRMVIMNGDQTTDFLMDTRTSDALRIYVSAAKTLFQPTHLRAKPEESELDFNT